MTPLSMSIPQPPTNHKLKALLRTYLHRFLRTRTHKQLSHTLLTTICGLITEKNVLAGACFRVLVWPFFFLGSYMRPKPLTQTCPHCQNEATWDGGWRGAFKTTLMHRELAQNILRSSPEAGQTEL